MARHSAKTISTMFCSASVPSARSSPLKRAWCSGRYFSKAATIARTVHTKMPEFHRNSPERRKTCASSRSGFSVKHFTRLTGLASDTWM